MSKPAPLLSVFSSAIKLAVIILALAYTSEKAAEYHTVRFAIGSASHNVLVVFAFWAALLRPGFALCALWAASDIFASLGKGAAFGPAMIKGMHQAGLNLIFGAIGALVLAPLFGYLAYGDQPIVYGPHIESLTFGLIGLVFYAVARQGRALTAELAQYV